VREVRRSIFERERERRGHGKQGKEKRKKEKWIKACPLYKFFLIIVI